MCRFRILILFYWVYVVQFSLSEEQPEVSTKLGKYRGHYVSIVNGEKVIAFNGIRYGQQPQRFKEAEKAEPHKGIYDATKDGNDCVQLTSSHNYNKYPETEIFNNKTVGSEDCLFLNIYIRNLNPSEKYPVMVWIPGGGYMLGTGSSIIYGPELMLEKDIILVSINYRLNIFGFFAYDDEVIPGNYGLKDQSLALHWVKENIEAFGGDPESITIFGQSAGGSSVHLQMHSPRNKGVFHRAIAQSGSFDCPWSLSPPSKVKRIALKTAAILNCPTNPEEMLTCLQGKSTVQLLDAYLKVKRTNVELEVIFMPVVERKSTGFITKKDLEARSTMPWMEGVTSGEGLLYYEEMSTIGDKSLSDFNKNYHLILPELLWYSEYPQVKKMTKMIKQYYVGDEDFNLQNIKQFTDMFSDSMFNYGQLQSSIKHKGQTYFYYFDHVGERSVTAFNNMHHFNAGASHCDDILYLFPIWKYAPELLLNEEDSKMHKLMVELWTNFATYGDPTPGKEEPKWPESANGKYYVKISPDGIKVSENLFPSRMEFWDNLYKKFNKDDVKDEL